jgi:general secretion pathway protein I
MKRQLQGMAVQMRGAQKGFSLLELLVAFAIMAMSLGLLYRLAGGSARDVANVDQNQQATWLAESLLASQSSVSASGWNETGESAGFQWQIRSSPYTSAAAAPAVTALHEVQLSVSWTSGARPGSIELVTLRPQRKAAAGEVVR